MNPMLADASLNQMTCEIMRDMRAKRPTRDSRRDSGRRRKTLSESAIDRLWKVYRREQRERLTRGATPDLKHFAHARQRRKQAIDALERLRWIDEELFVAGDARAFVLRDGDSAQQLADHLYATQPINALIDRLHRQDASEQDRERDVGDRVLTPDRGRPDELGAISREMRRLAAAGESPAALARHYVDHVSGKGGLPDIPFDLLLERIKKGTNRPRADR
jgi:hypothetical protein